MKQTSPLTKIAFLALLVLFLGSPAVTSLDPWDAFPDSGDTALFVLWAAALCLGASLLLARSIGPFRRAAIRAIRMLLLLNSAIHSEAPLPRSPLRSPTLLRI